MMKEGQRHLHGLLHAIVRTLQGHSSRFAKMDVEAIHFPGSRCSRVSKVHPRSLSSILLSSTVQPAQGGLEEDWAQVLSRDNRTLKTELEFNVGASGKPTFQEKTANITQRTIAASDRGCRKSRRSVCEHHCLVKMKDTWVCSGRYSSRHTKLFDVWKGVDASTFPTERRRESLIEV